MSIEHLSSDQLARLFTAVVLVGLGVFEIRCPRCFWGIGMYFWGTWSRLSGEQSDRLERVIDARTQAEGNTDSYTRVVGILTIVIAPIVIFPAVPFVLPYALSCLAMADAILMAYLRFRRATERRVAPLVRRSPFSALPPIVLAAAAICVLGAGTFAALPQYRIGAIIVVVSAIALCAIAWRVAVAPAMLLGDDPQLEYTVDEHVRFCRATGLISLACAPPTVLVALASAALPASAHFYAAVTIAVWVAFVVVIINSLNPMRKRISLA